MFPKLCFSLTRFCNDFPGLGIYQFSACKQTRLYNAALATVIIIIIIIKRGRQCKAEK